MGFITSLTINNDLLHELGTSGSFLGRSLYHAVLEAGTRENISVPYAGITVVESHHADYTRAILVGGGQEARAIPGISVHYAQPDPELELLRQLAQRLGYDLRRKRAR
jgi:hypothetical protein